MDTRRLRCFLALAEELHFRRAAERLHMTQPPLSVAIRQLEEDLGVRLIDRTTRSVSLTPAGLVLQREGRAIVAQMDRARRHVQTVAAGLSGTLAIGFVGAAMAMGLNDWIRGFNDPLSDVALELYERPTEALVEDLLSEGIDVAFLRGTPRDPLDYRSVACESYWVALPEGHPLTGKLTLELSDLHQQALLFFPRVLHPEIYDEWMATFRSAAVVPHITQEVRSLTTELALVSAGMGLALVPESVTHEHQRGIIYRPLAGDVPQVELSVAWHPDRDDELIQRFLSTLP